MQKVKDEQFFHRFNSGQSGGKYKGISMIYLSVGARGRAECENKTHSGAIEEEATSTSL